jgi:hypothetical protein
MLVIFNDRIYFKLLTWKIFHTKLRKLEHCAALKMVLLRSTPFGLHDYVLIKDWIRILAFVLLQCKIKIKLSLCLTT